MSEIFEKLEHLDRRYYYWIIFVILAVPYIKPIGLPITVKPSTKDLYEGIKEVEEGDIVMVNYQMSVSTWPECMGGLAAEIKMLTEQGAKLVFTSISVDCEMSWNRLNELVPRLRNEYVYGEDVVFLGYYTGGEPTVQQLAQDVTKVFSADNFRTPVEELPLIAEADNAEDYALVLCTGEHSVPWIQQWGTPYGIPVGMMGMAMKGSALQPFYQSGDLFGLAVGVRGAAELEALIGEPAGATTRMDSISLSHITVVLLIVIANIGVAYSKTASKEET